MAKGGQVGSEMFDGGPFEAKGFVRTLYNIFHLLMNTDYAFS